jgi:hypothetical protein
LASHKGTVLSLLVVSGLRQLAKRRSAFTS